MTALIYVDLESVHPVINGVWHRAARLQRMPQSGESVRMLCGVIAAAEYEQLGERRRGQPPTCCWECDVAYRREQGIPVRATTERLPTPRPRDHR